MADLRQFDIDADNLDLKLSGTDSPVKKSSFEMISEARIRRGACQTRSFHERFRLNGLISAAYRIQSSTAPLAQTVLDCAKLHCFCPGRYRWTDNL